MYTTFYDLCKAIANEPIIDKNSLVARCFRLYLRAQKAAEKFGFVGVGCVTFAENRLIEFQRRAYGFKHKIGETVMVTTWTEQYEAKIVGYGAEQVAGLQGPEHTMLVYDVVTATGQPRWCYKAQVDG